MAEALPEEEESEGEESEGEESAGLEAGRGKGRFEGATGGAGTGSTVFGDVSSQGRPGDGG